MEKLRRYGNAPFEVTVIHGGPGAPAEAAPMARELSTIKGVLEPLQASDTCEGQVVELKTILEENAALPVTLIGHSRGAMLSYLMAARYSSLVKKLVLVASASFEDEYAAKTKPIRLGRLGETLWTGGCHPFSSAHQRLRSPSASITATVAKFEALPALP